MVNAEHQGDFVLAFQAVSNAQVMYIVYASSEIESRLFFKTNLKKKHTKR